MHLAKTIDEIDHLRELIATAHLSCHESYEFGDANGYTFEALDASGSS
jgi:hypothetical protein